MNLHGKRPRPNISLSTDSEQLVTRFAIGGECFGEVTPSPVNKQRTPKLSPTTPKTWTPKEQISGKEGNSKERIEDEPVSESPDGPSFTDVGSAENKDSKQEGILDSSVEEEGTKTATTDTAENNYGEENDEEETQEKIDTFPNDAWAQKKLENERNRIKDIIKKSEIVTELDEDSTEDVPIEKQGDLSMYSNKNQVLRKELRFNEKIMKAIEDLWNVEDLVKVRDEKGRLGHDIYVSLLIKFQYLIVPHPIQRSKAIEYAEEDWKRDTNNGGNDARMTFEEFAAGIFELADTWALTTNVSEYVKIIRILLEGVTKVIQTEELVESNQKNALEEIPENQSNEPKPCEEVRRPSQEKPKLGILIPVDFKYRKLLMDDEIQHDPFFGLNAAKKHTKYKSKLKKVRKGKGSKGKAGTKRLTLSTVLQQISKLYQSKHEQDQKNNSRRQPLTRFDSFIKDQFKLQYGSKKMARKHLNTFIKSVRQKSKTNARVRLFAKLAGIEIESIVGDNIDFLESYDPYLCSDYALPVLVKLAGTQNLNSSLPSDGKATRVMMFNFKSTLKKICKRIPENTMMLHTLYEDLDDMQEIVKPNSQLDQNNKLFKASDLSNKSFTNLAGFVKTQMKSRISIASFSKRCLVDIDKAMLASYNLWRCDRKWHLLFKYVVAAKAVKHWVNKTFNGNRKLAQSIHTLTSVPTTDVAVDRTEFYGIVTVNAACEIVENITGVNFREAIELSPAGSAISKGEELHPEEQERESQSHVEEKELEVIEEESSKTQQPEKPNQEGNEIFKYKEPPTPQTPSKVTAAFDLSDETILAEIQRKFELRKAKNDQLKKEILEWEWDMKNKTTEINSSEFKGNDKSSENMKPLDIVSDLDNCSKNGDRSGKEDPLFKISPRSPRHHHVGSPAENAVARSPRKMIEISEARKRDQSLNWDEDLSETTDDK